MMIKCSVCNEPYNAIRSVIRSGKIYNGCDNCLSQQIQKGNSAAFNRRYQQTEYRKELTQPNQREYARAYPDDFRKRHGDELYRLMG